MVRTIKKKVAKRFIVRVKEKGFPEGELKTVRKGKLVRRTFKTKATALRAARALKRKKKGKFIPVKGRVKRLKRKLVRTKIKQILV